MFSADSNPLPSTLLGSILKVDMSDFMSQIEHEFQQAFQVRDRRALHRAAALISERVVDRPTYTREVGELRSDIHTLNDTTRLGFEQMERRFEQVDRRFEQVDKRFEDLMAQTNTRFEQVDKRFEDLIGQMNARFEQVDRRFKDLMDQTSARFEQADKRFDDLIGQTNARFEVQTDQMNRRFEDLQRSQGRQTSLTLWFGSAAVTLLAAMMSLYQFLG